MHLKLGPLELGRRELAAATVASVQSGRYGSDGMDDFYSGFLADDPNPLWVTTDRYRVIREMQTDPSVSSALLLWKLPIRSATWRVDPASDDPTDLLVADACAWQLGIGTDDGPLSGGWSAVLAQSLRMLELGSMFEEKIWSPDTRTFKDADGNLHELLVVQHLGSRAPSTAQIIRTNEDTGELEHFEQWLPGTRPIPPAKLIPHAIGRKDGSWWGESMLRPMWGSWKLKKQMMIASGIGWDRWAAGIPEVRHPAGDGNARKAEQIGRSVRQNERGYLAFEATSEWEFKIHNGAATIADAVPLIRLYSEQIADAALAYFVNLASSQTGSRAVGDVLIDPFFEAVAEIAKQLGATYRRHLLREFVTLNFGADVDLPKVCTGRIGTRDIAMLCQALYDASSAGLDFKDAETQDAIRQILELPDLPDDYAPPAAPPAGEGSGPPFVMPALPPAAPPPAA